MNDCKTTVCKLVVGVVSAFLGALAMYIYLKRMGKEGYANQVVHGGAGGIAGPISLDPYYPYHLDHQDHQDTPEPGGPGDQGSKERNRKPVVAYPPNDTCGGGLIVSSIGYI